MTRAQRATPTLLCVVPNRAFNAGPCGPAFFCLGGEMRMARSGRTLGG